MSKVQIVWFRDLVRWDIKHYLYELKSVFPLVYLKDYIIESKDRVKPFDFPDKTFDILGVNNKSGVYFNESLLGSRIKQPYYQVRSGDVFYNPYRINVGSIGIVPQEFDLKYTSPAYVVFRTNEEKLLSHFLVFVLKSTWFNEHLRAKTRGSVRQNLSFEALCDVQIPLPPLEIQKEIVAKVESIKAQIKALQEEEKRLKNEIETYIYIALGLQKPKVLARQKVFIVRFKDLTRWDTRHNQSFATHLKNAKSHTDSTTHEADENLSLSLRGEAKAIHLDIDCHSPKGLRNDKKAVNRHDFATQNLTMRGLDSTPTPPPQGWEMVTLGELLSYERSDTYIVSSEKYNNEYKIPVLTAGKTFILGYTDEKENIYKNVPVIIFDDFTTATQFVDFEFKVKSSAMKILKNRNDKLSNIKFIFYAMQTIKLNLSLALRRYWISMYKDIKIPLPPLAVQEQIVMQVEALQSEIKGIDNELHALEQKRLALLQHYLSATNERERERELSKA